MALFPCRECGKDVSTEAAACPHCGAPNLTGSSAAPTPIPPPVEKVPLGQRNIGTAKGCAIGCLGFILIVVLIGLCSGGGDTVSTPTASSGDPGSAAYSACTRAVRERLRAPSTADFPWADYRWAKREGGDYLITSHVDAQNAFGAQIRSNWMCIVRQSGNSWVVQEATVIE